MLVWGEDVSEGRREQPLWRCCREGGGWARWQTEGCWPLPRPPPLAGVQSPGGPLSPHAGLRGGWQDLVDVDGLLQAASKVRTVLGGAGGAREGPWHPRVPLSIWGQAWTGPLLPLSPKVPHPGDPWTFQVSL